VVKKLIDVLRDAGGWMNAQDAFRGCGIVDGSATELIEDVYAELRELERSKRVAVEAVRDAQGQKLYDRLKLTAEA
jgi:type I restriction enzyme S subunit